MITHRRIFMPNILDTKLLVEILTGIVEGKFPKRALHHILEWYELHRDELIDNWTRCKNNEEPNQIDPLE